MLPTMVMKTKVVYLLQQCKDHRCLVIIHQKNGVFFLPTETLQKLYYVGHYSGNSLPPPEIVNHLVDLFFKYINSVIPFIHRVVLKKSIQDGTVSHPLLYSVMALSAR